MSRQTRDRSGVILWLLSMVVVMIGFFIMILEHSQSVNRRVLFMKKEKAQAQFLARAAQQHFLLKLRFLSAQMYEAMGFSVGKNPYYDFGGYMRSMTDDRVEPYDHLEVGPLFYTGGAKTKLALAVPKGDSQAPAESHILVIDRAGEDPSPTANEGVFTGPAFRPGSVPGGDNKQVMKFLLENFLADVSSDYPTGKSVVRFSSQSSDPDRAFMGQSDPDGGGPGIQWVDPFVGHYFVEDFRILGQGGGGARRGKKFEADSVEVATEGKVYVRNQISPITGKSIDTVEREMKTVLTSKPGDGGWTKMQVTVESKAEFDNRVGEDSSKYSSKQAFLKKAVARSEIVTATYFIRRPTKKR